MTDFKWRWYFGGDSIDRQNEVRAAAGAPTLAAWFGNQRRLLPGEPVRLIDLLELHRLAWWASVMIYNTITALHGDGDIFGATTYHEAAFMENAIKAEFMKVSAAATADATSVVVEGNKTELRPFRKWMLTASGEILFAYDESYDGGSDTTIFTVKRSAAAGAAPTAIAAGEALNWIPNFLQTKSSDTDYRGLIGFGSEVKNGGFYDGWLYGPGEISNSRHDFTNLRALVRLIEYSGSWYAGGVGGENPVIPYIPMIDDSTFVCGGYATKTADPVERKITAPAALGFVDIGLYLRGEALIGPAADKRLTNWHVLRDRHAPNPPYVPTAAHKEPEWLSPNTTPGGDWRLRYASMINDARALIEATMTGFGVSRFITWYKVYGDVGYSFFQLTDALMDDIYDHGHGH